MTVWRLKEITLKIKAADFFEMLLSIYQTTRHHILEDHSKMEKGTWRNETIILLISHG